MVASTFWFEAGSISSAPLLPEERPPGARLDHPHAHPHAAQHRAVHDAGQRLLQPQDALAVGIVLVGRRRLVQPRSRSPPDPPPSGRDPATGSALSAARGLGRLARPAAAAAPGARAAGGCAARLGRRPAGVSAPWAGRTAARRSRQISTQAGQQHPALVHRGGAPESQIAVAVVGRPGVAVGRPRLHEVAAAGPAPHHPPARARRRRRLSTHSQTLPARSSTPNGLAPLG